MIVFGHGDDSPLKPINTLRSIDIVRSAGADGIECDVRLTADEVVVVTHDHALVDGRLVAHTRVGDLPSEVPTLVEFLNRARDLVVNIEIKNFLQDPAFDPSERITERTLGLLSQRQGRDQILISCFGLGSLDLIRARAPEIPTAVLLLSRRPADDLLNQVVQHGHSIVHPYDSMVDDRFMIEARRRSLQVNVWVGSLTDDRVAQLMALDVDGIISDDPARVLRACSR